MADDKDFRPFNVNLSTVGRFGGAGLLGGSSAAAALVLVKMLKDLSEERTALTQPTEEEQNTITLTLPKRASSTDKSENEERINEKVKSRKEKSKSGTKAATTPGQIRNYNGEYSIKTANWQTLAASLLALGAGGGLGYSLVNKVYDIKKKKELEAKVQMAKQEYMDQLSNTTKQAGMFGGVSGRQGDPSFSLLDYPGGLAAVALLLGGGSTAWLTKKMLDEYNKDPENKYKPANTPHIDRIVFKTEGAQHEGLLPSMARAEDKDASAQDTAEAALGVYLDLMSGEARILGEVKCGADMLQAGTDPEAMYKMASEDYNRLVQFLKQNPQLRTTIKRLAMEKHPILKYFKWTSDLPLIKAYGDNKLYDTAARRYGPTSDIYDAARAGKIEQKFASVKTAGLPMALGSVSAGSTGGLLAALAFENAKGQPAAQEAPAAETPEGRNARIEKIVQNIQLGAKDPKALAFVQQNSEKIRNILLLLAQEGKI